ncbi:MAG: ChaN family lipoprotein [Bacteroidales bacterium]|nr:ChaN family lipoprotein [Bacteroidales bacterium]
MILKFLLAAAVSITGLMSVSGQENPAYRLYNTEGKEIKYSAMLKGITGADAVFLGELHNNPIAHWIELEVTEYLFEQKGSSLVLGAEMFERDDQLIINEYLAGLYDASKFEAEVKLWKNYKTDYRPLVEFSRENGLPFIATNIPRRYASMVNKGGFEALDSLSGKALGYLAPLPFPYDPELKCYSDMMQMGGGHATENLPKAQAAKDATMAWSLAENWSEGKVLIHYNGSYHSKNHQGIIWYLNHYLPGMEIVTIEIVSQYDISTLEEENIGIADFIIAVPANMTTTY